MVLNADWAGELEVEELAKAPRVEEDLPVADRDQLEGELDGADRGCVPVGALQGAKDNLLVEEFLAGVLDGANWDCALARDLVSVDDAEREGGGLEAVAVEGKGEALEKHCLDERHVLVVEHADGGGLADLVLPALALERQAHDGVVAEAAELTAADVEDDGVLGLQRFARVAQDLQMVAFVSVAQVARSVHAKTQPTASRAPCALTARGARRAAGGSAGRGVRT